MAAEIGCCTRSAFSATLLLKSVVSRAQRHHDIYVSFSLVALLYLVAVTCPTLPSRLMQWAAWKVMLAAVIKSHTSATNVWITEKLNMGISQAVSQNVGKFHAAGGRETEAYQELIINITT